MESEYTIPASPLQRLDDALVIACDLHALHQQIAHLRTENAQLRRLVAGQAQAGPWRSAGGVRVRKVIPCPSCQLGAPPVPPALDDSLRVLRLELIRARAALAYHRGAEVAV